MPPTTATYTRETMRAFALALAANHARRFPRTYVADDDVLAAISGHALCFANAHRVQVVLDASDLAAGLAVYRRARAQRRPARRITRVAALPLLRIVGRHRVA